MELEMSDSLYNFKNVTFGLTKFNSTVNSTNINIRKFTHPIFSRGALIGICLFWVLMLVGPCVVASLENKRRLRRNEKLYKLENNTLKVNKDKMESYGPLNRFSYRMRMNFVQCYTDYFQ